MTFFPFIRKQYLTDIKKEEILNRVERTVAKPDNKFTFQKATNNRVLEGKIEENGFIVVMGRFGMTFGKTSLLPYLIAKFKPNINDRTRLEITIQPSLGSGLVILSIVYILAAIAIYISWSKKNVEGIIVPGLLIVVTYISMVLKFNREKKTYLDFIEKVILIP
jgi:hypothetical protein